MHDVDALIAAAERAPFSGWDFSHLAGRWREAPPPWDYLARARALAAAASSLLDVGTGGGEKLASLGDALPGDTWAVEAYAPNVPVARARLEPLGVRVVAIDPADLHPVPDQDTAYRLPFPAARFDLVLSRHEAYDPAEVARVLRPGGRFVTQQVGGRSHEEINAALGASRYFLHDWSLPVAVEQLRAAGLRIDRAAEAVTHTEFSDAGALAYYLKAVPWQVPGFTIAGYRAALRAVPMPLRATSHPFLIEAVKPGG